MKCDGILLVLSLVFGCGSSIVLLINYLLCAHQCLLFGRLYEVIRVQESGHRGWCLMCISTGFLTGLLALVIVMHHTLRFLRNLRLSHFLLLCIAGVCAMLMCTNACIITSGFHYWCSTLKQYSCSHYHISFMDWKMFKPRYNDCYGAWILLMAATVCSWCSFASWSLVAIIFGLRFAFK